jgi:hypothetical protein
MVPNQRPDARILLELNPERIEGQSMKQTREELRDHLGHTLLYLRSPKAKNDCMNALLEWRRSVKDEIRKSITKIGNIWKKAKESGDRKSLSKR